MNVLIAEPLAQAGIDLFRAQPGWQVIQSNPQEYTKYLADADALIIRSAVPVTADIIRQAPKLRVIGRAGVGVDHIDLAAATAAGVLVMNTPGGNAASVAEHTIALMLSMARSIPQAVASTKAGKWEKKKFLGSELRGKTLGVIGFGSIGREVVKRARAFEMRCMACDPYVTPGIARDHGAELLTLNELYAQADYITLHVSLSPQTIDLLNADAFAKMKRGVRIVNCARGELVDEQALKAALESGQVAGAALDVFHQEPTDSSNPLLAVEGLLPTPHIGGATEEAQDIVGTRIAAQMLKYIQTGEALNSVNMPSLSAEQYRAITPFIELADRLGNFAAHLLTGNPTTIRFTYYGRIADLNTNVLRNAGLAGILRRSTAGRANLVNAMPLVSKRGWRMAEVHDKHSGHADSLRIEIETDTTTLTVEGSVVLGRPRLMQVDGFYCEAPLTGPVICLKNLDLPGVVGHIGNVLGANQINIANFSMGRRASGEPHEAIAVVATDTLVPQDVLDQLMSNPAVKLARAVAM